MKKQTHIKVFYSPNCPFSFREIKRIRETVATFGDKVVYEEINMYSSKEEAEKMGFYGLLSKVFIPLFIDNQRYEGSFNKEELGNAIRKALENIKC